jgi:hypothetical protein
VRHRRTFRGKCIRSLLIRQKNHPHLLVNPPPLGIWQGALTWRVFDVEGVVLVHQSCSSEMGLTYIQLSNIILDDTVPSMSLIDSDLSLGSHVMEPLFRVDTSFQRSSPGSSVDSCTPLIWVGQILPVDEEGDGIFSLGVTAHGCGDTGSC